MEEIKSKFSILSQKLSEVCFACKDILLSRDEISLETTRKNMITKVFTPKSRHCKPFVFLIATSYFNSQRMVEVVTACLRVLGKTVITPLSISEEFTERLSFHISNNDHLNVHLLENSIVLSLDNLEFQVFDVTEMDQPAKEFLTRSFCLSLAFCGKIVNNNIDNYIVNDYGIVNTEAPSITDEVSNGN
jgi:hypothetical protein